MLASFQRPIQPIYFDAHPHSYSYPHSENVRRSSDVGQSILIEVISQQDERDDAEIGIDEVQRTPEESEFANLGLEEMQE